MDSDRTIPAPIKREVRQRCGFGCVMCGHPIYQYDHLIEWSKVHEHTSDNIVLLCPAHHAEKTKGLLTTSQVEVANAKPYNISQGLSSPYGFRYEGHDQKLILGENVFTNDIADADTAVVPLMIDGAGIVGLIIEDGKVFLNLNLFDENDRLIVRVEENELMFMPDIWDITSIGTKLTVREATRKVILEIDFQVPGTVVIERAEIACRGIRVRIRDGVMAVLNNKSIIRNATFNNAPVAVSLGDSADPDLHGAINLVGIERSGIDWKERDAWFRHETMWF